MTQTPQRILRGDAYSVALHDYFENELGKKFSRALNAKTATLQEGAPSYRVISHWESSGILNSDRPSGSGWRKFSAMDRVWIWIVSELRKFGASLETIKNVKASLSTLSKAYGCEFPVLELYVIFALHGR